WFVNFQLPMQGRPVPVLLSSQLKQEILPHVGASKYLNGDGTVGFYRDSLDLAFVQGIKIRDMTTRSQNGQVPTGMPSKSRPSNFYNLSKNEHIPEVWFNANVPKGKDHNDIAPSGYTWLEEYLNQVDGPSVIVATQSVEVTPGKTNLQISKTLQLKKEFKIKTPKNQNGKWTSSDEDIAKVDANALVTGISVGKVTITFTADDGGDKGKSEITVFREALQASAGTDQNICQGESTTLTASGGASYLWSTDEKTETITVRPNSTKIYTVTAYDSKGKNATTDKVTVNVNPVPVVDAGSNIIIRAGESTTLKAKGASNYMWNTGATGSSITVSPRSTTTYTVTGTNKDCEATDTVKVTVLNYETVVADAGGERNLCAGSSTTLTARGGSSYLWSTGEKTAKISVSPSVTTIYTVTAYDSKGENSDQADVKIVVKPVPAVDAGSNITINPGESTTLRATGADGYKWSTGGNHSSITVSPKSTTTYTVTGNNNDCEATDTVTVTVSNSETVTADAGGERNLCAGSSTTLTARGGSTYLWSTGEKTEKITVSPSISTIYTVTAYDSSGKNSDKAYVKINVNPIPAVDAGSNVTINAGESTTLRATGGDEYQWSTGGTRSSITVSPKSTATYTVIGIRNSCEALATVKVTVVNQGTAKANSKETTGKNKTATNNSEVPLGKSNPNFGGDYEAKTHLQDEPIESGFLIYPNPTFGDVNINISNVKSISSIHLYDSSGRLLYSDKINEGDQKVYEKTISLSGYPSGLYLLKLVDNEKVITKKIILK
ncbi:putative secreted protein (Por secretion system target), partial [Gelidibacter algens]